MSINYQLIGHRVREYRCRQQLRQETVAWDAEISVSYLSCIENGIKQASLSSFSRIADALNVPLETLLFGTMSYSEEDAFQNLFAIIYDCGEIEHRIIIDTVLSTATAIKRGLRTSGLL